MRSFNSYAQERREMWVIRRATSKLRDDRPPRTAGTAPQQRGELAVRGPAPIGLDSRARPVPAWLGLDGRGTSGKGRNRARAREQFERLFDAQINQIEKGDFERPFTVPNPQSLIPNP